MTPAWPSREVVEQPPDPCTWNWPPRFRCGGPTGVGPARRIPPATLELLYIRGADGGGTGRRSPLHWVRDDGGGDALRFAEAPNDPDDDAVLLVLGTREDNGEMRLRAGEALSHPR